MVEGYYVVEKEKEVDFCVFYFEGIEQVVVQLWVDRYTVQQY